MTKKDKSTVDDIDSKSTEELLNGDGNDVVADDSSEAEGVGTPTYEELFDKNEELEKELAKIYEELNLALIPKDATDEADAIIEIRAGSK